MVHVKSLLPNIPDLPPTNIHAFLIENPALQYPDHLLFVDGITGETRTRRQFIERVKRARTALCSSHEDGGLELGSGNMVAILSENCMDYITLVHTLWSINVPFAPCSAYATQYELAHLLRLSRATYIFTHANRLKIALAAAKEVGIPTSRILILQGNGPNGYKSLDGLIKESERRNTPIMPTRPVQSDTLAFVLFSSGTTGLPKAVALSHNNFVYWNRQTMAWSQSVQESADPIPSPPPGRLPTVMAYLPFYHTYGLSLFSSRYSTPLHTVQILRVGSSLWIPTTVVIIPRWNTELVLRLIPKYKVTSLPSVPAILEQLSSSPDLAKTDMSSIIGIASGASYLPPSLAGKITKQVGIKNTRLAHGYGLSEVTVSSILMTVNGQLNGYWSAVPNSTGALIPGMEARIVREDGSEADYDEPGELWLKGKSVALGYYGNPKATAETFVNGWLKTGDQFTVDRKGYFYFQDRSKDTLKVSGMQVSPTEIENELLNCPNGLVKEVTVAGVEVRNPKNLRRNGDGTGVHGISGSERVPRAWIVLSERGKALGERQCWEQLDSWVKTRLSRYKWLKGGISFVAEIPKTPTGKVLRRQLVDEYARQNQDQVLVSARL